MQIDKCLVLMGTLISLLLGFNLTACAANRSGDSSSQRQTLMHDGIERSYLIRTPRKLAKSKDPLPLVLVLHGGGGNADNAEKMTGFTEKVEKEGFIVVYPEGTGRLNGKLLTWNAGHCCGSAMKNKVDDVGFINTLIDTIAKKYPVDPKRIYATGMSNGGMMAHQLGIRLSGRLAAIAPVVATLFGDETRPKHPVSALMLNGMEDNSVPYKGGPPGGRGKNAWDGLPAKPAMEQASFWAEANGCTDLKEDDQKSLIVSQYRCPAGIAVEIYLIKEGGHAWPGGKQGSRLGDDPGSALNGTDVIWTFFKAHAK